MSRAASDTRTQTALADFGTDEDLYGPGSAAWSPAELSVSGVGIPEFGLPQEVNQQEDPDSHTNPAGTKGTSQIGDSVSPIPDLIVIGRPPLPSTGGQPGRSSGLGWSTGLLPSRTHRQKFTGKVLVVPSQGVHPVVGPVGFSNRSNRLASGVAALVDTWLPSQQQINEDVVNYDGSDVSPRNRNPLG